MATERKATEADAKFLRSQGYKIETVKDAQAFIDKMPAEDYAEYMKELAGEGTDQDRAPAAPGKKATIVTGTKIVKVGGKDIRVPVTAEITKESDLKPEHILPGGGPTKPRYGDKKLRCYITVNARRLSFGPKGNLVKED